MATEETPKSKEEKAAPAPDAPPTPAAPPADAKADALSDGTVPTTLAQADGTHTVIEIDPKKANINKVYRRADIATSVITLIAVLAVVAIILGLYIFFGPKKKTVTPKVTTLSQSEITKLGGFLTSGNGLGSSGTVLTVTSAALFKGRVAIDADLKVTGNTEVGGNLSSKNLTVTGNSTLATTSVNGPLTVTGPTTLQSPTVLAGGATVGNNLTVAGNGTFGGAISAGSFNTKNLTVSGDLNLAGHLVITGAAPTVTADVGAGTGGKATVEGNDSGGTIVVSTGTMGTNTNTTQTNGLLSFVVLKFHTPYAKTPHVLITPVGRSAAVVGGYVLQTATGFTINILTPATASDSVAFNYWVVQ